MVPAVKHSVLVDIFTSLFLSFFVRLSFLFFSRWIESVCCVVAGELVSFVRLADSGFSLATPQADLIDPSTGGLEWKSSVCAF